MKYLAYTYLIKCPNGKSYYGYRSANETSPEDDLWKHYFTSSKVIAELREQYSDDEFIATIDKTFATAEEAVKYEEFFLTENDCAGSDEWVNKKNSSGEWHNVGGYKLSEKTKRKMSEAQKGKTVSLETRRKMGEWQKGRKLCEETKKKLSEANGGDNHPCWGKFGDSHPRYGIKTSEEAKIKISEAKRKLTNEQEEELYYKSKRGGGDATYQDLMNEYGVGRSCIKSSLNRISKRK